MDREHVYGTLADEDIFDLRGIDRDGAIVLVRPDQYVAGVWPVAAVSEFAAFFARLTPTAVRPASSSCTRPGGW